MKRLALLLAVLLFAVQAEAQTPTPLPASLSAATASGTSEVTWTQDFTWSFNIANVYSDTQDLSQCNTLTRTFDADVGGAATTAKYEIFTCPESGSAITECEPAITGELGESTATPFSMRYDYIKFRSAIAPGASDYAKVTIGCTTAGYKYSGSAWSEATISALDPTFNSVTVNPGATGGGVTLSECEATSGCPASGASNTLSIKLPDASNPLNANKIYSPGMDFSVGFVAADFDGEEAGGVCLNVDPSVDPADCDGALVSPNGTFPFVSGAFIDKCLVHVAEDAFTGWTASDILVLQAVTVDSATGGATETAIGDTFTLVDDGAGCGDLTGNCIEETADGGGNYTWQVNISAADCVGENNPFDCCTAASTGANCPAASTLDSGSVGISISSASNDQDADADIRIRVSCTYF